MIVKPLFPSKDLMCSWNWQNESNERAVVDVFWFRHIVQDCVNQLKKHKEAFCFSDEHLAEIMKVCNVKGIIITYEKENECGGYYITRKEKK